MPKDHRHIKNRTQKASEPKWSLQRPERHYVAIIARLRLCDVNAKFVIASKRSCRFRLYALTHKADNIPRIAELLPSRHYRNRYPPDKMSLAPKARGLFSQNKNKANNDGHRPTHYLQMAHDMLLAQLPELLRRALCSQTLPAGRLQIMSANHHPSEVTEPIGNFDIK